MKWLLLGALALSACTSNGVKGPADGGKMATRDLSTAMLDDMAHVPPPTSLDFAWPPGTDFMTAAHPPLPQLVHNGNAVITNLRLVSVVASGDPLAQTLFDFGDALVVSSWWTTVGADYGLGNATGSLHVTGPAIMPSDMSPDNWSGMKIKNYLTALATGDAAPDGHSVYVFYLPPGVGILDNNMKPIPGCVGFHFASFDAQGDVWAVIKRCDQTGATETYLASHEIAEGSADSAAGKGWSLPFVSSTTPIQMQDVWAVGEGHEAGDLCQGAGATMQGAFSYSRIWSNSAAAAGMDPCVPSQGGPYVNVSTQYTWMIGTATPPYDVPIPLTGWSSSPVGDWTVAAEIRGSNRMGFKVAFDNGASTATINNGTQQTLHVKVPTDATTGDYAVVRLLSTQPASPTEFGIWMVGVYVP
jgi:hypothetical protein